MPFTKKTVICTESLKTAFYFFFEENWNLKVKAVSANIS